MYDVLHDGQYRKKWDPSVLESFDVARLSANADVGYYSCESSSTPSYLFPCFCLLSCNPVNRFSRLTLLNISHAAFFYLLFNFVCQINCFRQQTRLPYLFIDNLSRSLLKPSGVEIKHEGVCFEGLFIVNTPRPGGCSTIALNSWLQRPGEGDTMCTFSLYPW